LKLVAGIKFNTQPGRRSLSLSLFVYQSLKNSFDDPFAAALGNNLEFFSARRVIGHLHDHLGMQGLGKALVFELVDALAAILSRALARSAFF
jgi:hypothetical protein